MATMTFIELEAARLAEWLVAAMPQAWWTADGEGALEESISFPCRIEELAPHLGALGKLRVFAPPEATQAWKADGDLSTLGSDEGDGLVFALGDAGDVEPRWLLVEDKVAEAAMAASF